MELSPNPPPAQRDEAGGEETLTVLEAARRAGVTQSAIIRWIRNGYLSATPSSEGWQIPAGMLAEAARAADEARGTGPVPRATGPTLAPTPTPIRHSLERRATIAGTTEDVGNHIVSPLAELIRDQIDVVHDQAEVIGWLQAERARLSTELENLKSSLTDSHAAHHEEEQTPDLPNEQELYDEVLSLLWKDAASPATQDAPADDWQADTTPEQRAAEDELHVEPPAAPEFDDTSSQPQQLNVEDFADPSWFFPRHDEMQSDQPRAVLQPIVPRAKANASDEDRVLHRMIDETEKKIADLWRNEAQLRSTPRVTHKPDEASSRAERETMWQRLWPLRR